MKSVWGGIWKEFGGYYTTFVAFFRDEAIYPGISIH